MKKDKKLIIIPLILLLALSSCMPARSIVPDGFLQVIREFDELPVRVRSSRYVIPANNLSIELVINKNNVAREDIQQLIQTITAYLQTETFAAFMEYVQATRDNYFFVTLHIINAENERIYLLTSAARYDFRDWGGGFGEAISAYWGEQTQPWKIEIYSPLDLLGVHAITTDNQLIAWWGVDDTTSRILAKENVVQVTSVHDYPVALTKDNTLWWLDWVVEGDTIVYHPIKISTNVKSVSSSLGGSVHYITLDNRLYALPNLAHFNDGNTDSHFLLSDAIWNDGTLAIKKDHSLWGWGFNHYGQLNNGTTAPVSAPVKIMENVRTATAHNHMMAITMDNTLWGWGRNNLGQVGDGTTTNPYTPVRIMDNVQQVSIGFSSTMALQTDGTLWAWGANWDYQLGDGTDIDRLSPVKIMDNIVYIVAGEQPWLSDQGTITPALAICNNGGLWSWGYNWDGNVGDGTRIPRPYPVKILDNVVYAMVGNISHAAVKKDGTLWVWGGMWANSMQIVHGDNSLGIAPTKVLDNIRLTTIND